MVPDVHSFASLFRRVRRPIDLSDEGDYPLVGVHLNGKGAFVRELKPGLRIRKKRHYILATGDIIYNKLFAWRGAFAVVPPELDGCFVSDKFPTYRLVMKGVLHDYLAAVFRSPSLAKLAEVRSVGSAAMSKFTLNPPKFDELACPIPSECAQRRTVQRLCTLDQQLEIIRETVERIAACAAIIPSAVVEELCRDHPTVPLGDLGELTRRSITIQDDVVYRQITIGMNNRGVRLRGEKAGIHIAVKNQAVVHAGDVVFSRIDIRNGAIGIVPPDLHGAAVANDFPVFVLGDEIIPDFADLAFRTRSFREQAIARSAGSTNRRKMRRDEFLKLRIPKPCSGVQKAIVAKARNAMEEAQQIQGDAERILVHAETLLASLVDSLVATRTEKVAVYRPIASKPRKHSKGIYFKRGAIATYIIDRLHQRPQFGRVMFEKCLYLAEAYVGVDLEGEYKRAAAGPLDAEYLHKLESLAAKQQWFTKRKNTGGVARYAYRPGRQASDRLTAAAQILGDRRERMDHLLGLMAMEKMDTERAEIVATLFAAWNDLLIAATAGDATPANPAQPSDDEIIAEVRNHWHEAKQRFDAVRLRRALDWMRENTLVPTGTAAPTIGGKSI